jgi:hypothetical protein
MSQCPWLPSCNKWLFSLGWQEIKILPGEQVLVLCSALKWRTAIVAKQKAPTAKPARVYPLALSGSHGSTMVGLALVHFQKSGC